MLRAFDKLAVLGDKPSANVRRLSGVTLGGSPLFSFRATDRLRIIFTKDGDLISVADISDNVKMGRLMERPQ
ncbi:hypothetical protein [Methylobacterium nodulans]|uniref:hypothetical protein n=1 Tax=Methylobacterium nodulans TaxID=114616 RepID=UPI0012EEDEB9|nr:hypothetical protein [Methylobacterium nodulans]